VEYFVVKLRFDSIRFDSILISYKSVQMKGFYRAKKKTKSEEEKEKEKA